MKIDHIGLQVDDIRESVDWYVEKFGCAIEYCDATWALLQFDNIKLALVSKNEHPNHLAFEVNMLVESEKFPIKKHRDGSSSIYINDLSGNKIELIKYKNNTKHYLEEFYEGKSFQVKDILYAKKQTKTN